MWKSRGRNRDRQDPGQPQARPRRDCVRVTCMDTPGCGGAGVRACVHTSAYV